MSEILFETFSSAEADAIINVVINIQITPVDYLINVVTFGLASARIVEITGEAVKIPGGLGALPTHETEGVEELKQLDSPLIQQDGVSNMIVHVQQEDGAFSYKLLHYK